MEVCAPAALDAMIGPKDLGAVVELDRFIGPLPGIAAGEGAVTGRMPVLGGAEMLEQGQDGVHRLEYLVTSRHPQRPTWAKRSEEHTSELQSRGHLVCRLLLEKKKKTECK